MMRSFGDGVKICNRIRVWPELYWCGLAVHATRGPYGTLVHEVAYPLDISHLFPKRSARPLGARRLR